MNQMAGAIFNLWIISIFLFYHLMNRMNQMAGDYFYVFIFITR